MLRKNEKMGMSEPEKKSKVIQGCVTELATAVDTGVMPTGGL